MTRSRGAPWTAEELRILAENNGEPAQAHQALLTAGFVRTITAVKTRMLKLRWRGELPERDATAYGVVTARVLAELERRGPMTREELCAALGKSNGCIAGVLHRLRDDGRAHIADWRRTTTGGREYPRAVYAAGPGIDKRKPPPIPKAEANRRFKASRRPKPASVFELALTPRKIARARRETAKAIKSLAELLCKHEEDSAMAEKAPLPPIEPDAPLRTRGGVMPWGGVLRSSDGLPIIRQDDPER